jgi:hypothetical protein
MVPAKQSLDQAQARMHIAAQKKTRTDASNFNGRFPCVLESVLACALILKTAILLG